MAEAGVVLGLVQCNTLHLKSPGNGAFFWLFKNTPCVIITAYAKGTDMTLLDQINYAEKTRHQIAQRLMEQDELLAELRALRFECDHDFAPALPGYEHEGGHCKKCGINEVFWACNRPRK